ncbi:inositol monophosphatase family protein [Rhizobium sp. LC145]|jgi:myo-inositol-1(or 4)-monophosphatase|uniref:inositol monophosphatase family protein n=1 Tax=Rhizobium sp. LC145 TaxID=1120688 RepID=UPI0009E46029|nr:inositol monophosphatase family protein [Rhizobium sp. LC145]TKT68685.1 inositol monophosphatase [Rhizobiaceae bacterium LC148]
MLEITERSVKDTNENTVKRHRLAQEIAIEAGRVALEYFRNRESLVVETKNNPQDLVSIADREVENLIRARIAAILAEDGFLGEESGLVHGSSGYTWVVDPIDGTSPFINGMPNWCVSIAVLHENRPVVGVIYVPCYDELYSGASGFGATLNGKPLKLDASKNIRNAVTGIGANHHVRPDIVGKMVKDLLEGGGNFVRIGSGALTLAYVAAGRLVGYYEPHMHAWDCLAGYCLVQEAGGWHLPFPVEGDGLTTGSMVLAAGPGAVADLQRLAGI